MESDFLRLDVGLSSMKRHGEADGSQDRLVGVAGTLHRIRVCANSGDDEAATGYRVV